MNWLITTSVFMQLAGGCATIAGFFWAVDRIGDNRTKFPFLAPVITALVGVVLISIGYGLSYEKEQQPTKCLVEK